MPLRVSGHTARMWYHSLSVPLIEPLLCQPMMRFGSSWPDTSFQDHTSLLILPSTICFMVADVPSTNGTWTSALRQVGSPNITQFSYAVGSNIRTLHCTFQPSEQLLSMTYWKHEPKRCYRSYWMCRFHAFALIVIVNRLRNRRCNRVKHANDWRIVWNCCWCGSTQLHALLKHCLLPKFQAFINPEWTLRL